MQNELRQLIETEILPGLRERAAQYDARAQRQLRVWRHQPVDDLPLLLSVSDPPYRDRLPVYDYEEIHHDSEKMFVHGLRDLLTSAYGEGVVPSMRANMGCGIFPSQFGLTQALFPDKMPWMQQHLPLSRVKQMDEGDLTFEGDFGVALDHMRYQADMLRGTGCHVYPLDLQGVVDCSHLVIGDEMFYAVYDDEEGMRHLFDLSLAALKRGMDACARIIEPEGYMPHYNSLALPPETPIKTSEDTSTLLGAEHQSELVGPYLAKLLGDLGGGYVHYCGRNPHLYREVLASERAIGLNFGNPDMHDMEKVLADCARAGKVYTGGMIPKPGDTRRDTFERALRASYRDGCFYLLMPYSCRMEQVDEVLCDWREAQAAVRGG